ncbi:sushi, von Willebrand factor type A, EGF and pentraxin domain-containing protein 1-like isoform X2 [Babylonia areolata]
MVCTTDDFRFPTVCRFTCQAGYQLLGSRKRSCLAIAFWTGIAARCREITCPPIPEIRDGSIQPALCTDGEVPFGTTCQLSCVRGYKLRGPAAKQCTPDGTWSSVSREPNQCVDETPPFIQCPENIEINADPENVTTEVTWAVPVAVDNSGFIPVLTSDPAVVPPAHFPIGFTVVTYRAEDLSENVAKCKFYILVVDETPPRVDKCFSPDPVVSSGSYGNVTWEEPIFSDNSGLPVEVSASNSPGLFPQGKTTVTYTATDSIGNNNTCVLQVVVSPHPCQYPDPPVNGERQCRESEEGVHCVLSCRPGYAFVTPPPPEYFCAYDNVWTPADHLPFPDCAAQHISNEVLQPASITLTGDLSCAEHKFLNRVEQNIEAKVNDKVSSLCEEDISCDMEEIRTTCDEHEDFNKINVVAKRRRRSADSSRRRRRRTASIKFDFTLEGTVNSTGTTEEASRRQEQLSRSMKKLLKALQAEAKQGHFDTYIGGRWLRFSDMDFDDRRQRKSCPQGAVLLDNSCVQCPVGMFFNVVSHRCQSCPQGTYQPTEGRVTCMVCPEKTNTSAQNARSQNECRAQCLPGSVSSSGLERCETCPKGFFQSQYAQVTCHPCPDGSTTLRRGAREKEQCRERCPSGHVSRTGLWPCYPCPHGTYQPESAQTVCIRCPAGADTDRRGATSLTHCVGYLEVQSDDAGAVQNQQQLLLLDANECFRKPCKNGGTCLPRDDGLFDCKCAPGFEGSFCEVEVDQCKARPCLNGGTCSPRPGAYHCDCTPGFEGQKCERDVDECASSPCGNGGTCVDGPNSFTCNCPNGFQGVTCESDIDDCEDEPCMNGGTCSDDVSGYRCACPVGFTGTTCEIETDECLSAPCRNGGTCVDELTGFRCECPGGYTGEQCEEEILECASDPCQHGAKCEDMVDAYKCHCKEGFTGKNCESEVDSHYQLDFPTASTVDYAAMSIDRPLTALTVSFWMLSDDFDNYGTVFSYAVPSIDNALTLTDYNGFAFYVNKESVVTDVATNDGYWHHVVITWSSNRGNWKIYVDGLLNDSGFDLSTAKPVPGRGTLVIGQEQDSVGGGFSANEAFVGSLTQFNVWDEELSLNTIESMRVSCQDLHGNVIAWPDVQDSLKGSLSAQPSTFCTECPVPDDVEFGSVNYTTLIPGSEVTYSCQRGFNVAGPSSIVCLVTGEYELPPPSCQRVDCGHPGSIDNGYFNEWRFFFDSRVRYRCQRGYKITGTDTLYCNEYGDWEGEKPQCTEITCKLPPLSENTLLTPPRSTPFRPGERATFGCAVGHKLLTSHDSVSCQSDGTWDRSVPTCDPQTCGSPPFIPFGEPDTAREEYNVGEIVRYMCDFGYILNTQGANTLGALSCLPSGQWETPEPECVLVECNEPPLVAHASMHGEERTFLSRVSYECYPGYALQGSGIIECLEDGQWDPKAPRCDPINCGKPPALPNGKVEGSDFSYNAVVTCSCLSGYKLVGSMRRRCNETGHWHGPDPACKPVTCGRLSAPLHGQVRAPVITFQAEAAYTCDEGYDLVGDASRTCTAEAQWSGEEPRCEPVTCKEELADIEHGSYTGPNVYTFGARVVYTCHKGYELIGKSELICLSSGRWSNEAPVCFPVECPQPAQPDHGAVNVKGLTFTSKVEYTCQSDYRLEGPSVRTCEADGSWSGEEPTCLSITCEPPPDIAHGQYDYKDLKVGSIVRYTCDKGYRLEGYEVRRCQSDLTLSGSEPTCVSIICPAPAHPLYGSVSLSDATLIVGTRATYTCDLGYDLVGEAVLTCGTRGVFIGTPPSCRPVECNKPAEIISNGRMLGDSFTFNSTVRYVCDEGYRMEGSSQRTCQANGKWDRPIPLCIVVECPRPSVVNGYPSTFRRTFGTVVSFTCRIRHRLEGSSERTCMADGTWSGEDAVCVKIVCPSPSPIQNGIVRQVNDVTLTYSCREGYRLEGSNTSSCSAQGLWDPAAPYCVQITCPDISSARLVNGIINFPENFENYGKQIHYQCNSGYTLSGLSQRRCMVTGQWEGEAPLCQIVSCPQPEAVLHGSVLGDVFTFGAEISYTCDEGYDLAGLSSRRCEASGAWEGIAPVCEIITCPQPEVVLHGSVLGDVFTFGAEISYTCDEGYDLAGLSSRRCEASGAWEGVAPVCEIITCPQPEVVLHGSVLGDVFTFGAEISYTCDEGYDLAGLSSRRCEASGAWEGVAPVCEIITCPQPEAVLHGSVLGDVFTFGAEINYECDEGHNLVGLSSRRCEASGAWEGVAPVCEIITCLQPEVVLHGSVLGDVFTFGAEISYTCDEGYDLVGLSSRRCEASGAWEGVAPVCEIITCLQPEVVLHGSVLGDVFTFGAEINYECDEGHNLVGLSSRRCEASGAWEGVAPHCQAVDCPEIDSGIENGIVNISSNTFGGQVTYSCIPGYMIEGDSTRTCLASGAWSGTQPVCVSLECPSPPGIESGTIIGDDYTIGRSVVYSCNLGYQPVGSTVLVCLPNLMWSGLAPVCERVSCTPLPPFQFGTAVGDGHRYGDGVLFVCDPGYELIGDYSRSCQADGTWDGELPECSPLSCGLPPMIDHAMPDLANGTLFPAVMTYKCDTGYKPKGNGVASCLTSGSWSVPNFVCELVTCSEIPSDYLEHGTIQGEDLSYGGVIHFACNLGYRLEGSNSSRCLAMGYWSAEVPVCLLITCDEPETIAHGTVTAQGYNYNDIATYKCTAGYQLSGEATARCLETGGWSKAVRECSLITCAGPPLVIPNGRLVGSKARYIYEDSVEYQCDRGFELVGTGRLTCTAEGVFVPSLPSCSKIQCPSPETPRHGNIQVVNDTLIYSCLPGYELSGPPQRRCLETGQWEGIAPACTAILCAAPLPVSNGIVSGDEFQFGSTVTYSCNPGFTLQGDAVRTCMAYRAWSGAEPLCVRVSCGAPRPIEHGTVYGDSYLFSDTISYECQLGFALIGQTERVCEESAEWSGEDPYCDEIMCDYPPDIINATHDADSPSEADFSFGFLVMYMCDVGHVMMGASSILCQEDGTWSEPYPACPPVTCPQLSALHHGYVKGDHNTYGGEFMFICERGYRLVGQDSLVCMEDGQWDGVVPECQQIVCEAPVLEHGLVLLQGQSENEPPPVTFLPGQAIEFICVPGYLRGGASLSRCLEDGEWTNEAPICQRIICGPPPAVFHARLSTVGPYYAGDAVSYVCDLGYELDGEASVLCSINGSWEGTYPTCVDVVCDNPPLVENARITGRDFSSSWSTPAGGWIQYECQDGFTLQEGQDGRLACLRGGAWSTDDLPRCIHVDCGPPPVPFKASVTSSGSTAGSVATVTCNEGHYLPDGARQMDMVCDVSGSWAGEENVHCAPVDCSQPPQVANTAPLGSVSTTYKSQVSYQCLPGYQMFGHEALRCSEDGSWVSVGDEMPRCEPVDCSQPPDVANTAPVGSVSTTYGSRVSYRCLSGYHLSGHETLQCSEDGSWVSVGDQAPSCEPADCSQPPQVANAASLGRVSTTYGSQVSYQCLPGYQMFGHEALRCSEDGSWVSVGDERPRCEPVDCSQPPDVANTAALGSVSTTYGSRVSYRCLPGYILSGHQTLRCSESGSWISVGDQAPSCDPVDCGVPETDMQIVGSDFTFGSTLTLTCPEGTRAVGSERVTCLSDGEWSPKPGRCEEIRCPPVLAPDHGYIFSRSEEVGGRVEILCDDGYQLTGDPVITCLSDGSWNSPAPTCQLIRDVDTMCVDSVSKENVIVPPGDHYPGVSVALSCRPGYQPQGDMTSQCMADRTWTQPTGSCRRLSCGPPPMENRHTVKVFGRSYLYGDRVMWMCRRGFSPSRVPPTLTCTQSGDWDGVVACVAQCKQPCKNGGRCVGLNKCKCLPGYTGRQCEIPICILPCLNGGKCLAPYRCQCPQGYYGSRCHKAVCRRPCKNGGRCLHPNRCQCFNGFKPPFCESQASVKVIS